MKVSKVLLRWYKSFNTNYLGYYDRRAGVVSRPWNLLRVENGTEHDYPFIEIPLENDITTIVGANESGKSHLISAISKVISGKGIPDERGNTPEYTRTDLCHFASVRSKNAEVWPQLGLEFTSITTDELDRILKAVGGTARPAKRADSDLRITLILAPDGQQAQAYLYFDQEATPMALNQSQLNGVRACLPEVKFIKSDVPIADQVPLSNLLAAYGITDVAQSIAYDFKAAQRAAHFLAELGVTKENKALTDPQVAAILELRDALSSARLIDTDATLEALLFRDVMGITSDTLKYLAGLEKSDRGYVEGLVAVWNAEIEKTLNLSHYWQQDQLFALRVDYKQGVIFFEITDKTGSIYTFRERSSGLRYFLSYYIQAKALERASRAHSAVILMDEPDSFLSILGQRNLLSVFESLVSAESSRQTTQLIYTTHSPFLINRNFPRRLRLVRKGDAEEGTQFIEQAMVRRYEPVRSALGIDCAQTLFMGTTNVVLEGPTDQYLLGELIRAFATPENVTDFLDLNAVIMVSAESAPGVEKLLAASQWGDEPVPAAVVVLDSDCGGDDSRKRITGIAKKCKKLIDDEFVIQIGGILQEHVKDQKVVTIEDLVPHSLFVSALRQYIARWYPDTATEHATEIEESLSLPSFGQCGVVEDTRKLFGKCVHGEEGQDFDKLGVVQEVVLLVNRAVADGCKEPWLEELQSRVKLVCQALRRKISKSQQAQRRVSGKQTIQRLIGTFFVKHKQASSVFEMELLFERLQQEAELLGEDGESLKIAVGRWLDAIRKMRAEKMERLVGEQWTRWKQVIEAIRKNPLHVTCPPDSTTSDSALTPSSTLAESRTDDGGQPDAEAAAPSSDIAKVAAAS